MVDAHRNLNRSRVLITLFQRHFAIRGLALATVNLPIKLEVSISTDYEDMKGDTKQKKWGGLGYLEGHSKLL